MLGVFGRSRFLKRIFVVAAVIAVTSVSAVAIINAKNETYAEAEVSPDVWKLSTSWVDLEGNTSKSETWNIDTSTTAAQERTFTLQVNYSATVVDKDYAPGDLKITVKEPFSGNSNEIYGTKFTDEVFGEQYLNSLSVESTAYAAEKKDATLSENPKDWVYECVSGKTDIANGSKAPTCYFWNRNTITAGTSVDGAIQLAYRVKSYGKSELRPPFFLENANFIYDNSIGATLNDTVESSDNATVHYNRSYGFEWTKDKYSVYISPKKINSYEGLGSDADNYTWVHYVYYGRSETGSAYRMPIRYNPETSIYSDYSTFRYYQRIPVKSWYWRDALSPDVKVLDANKNQMSRDANGYYVVSDAGYASGNTDAVCMTSYWTCKEIFVGYPKNKYNESLGNNELENTVYSRGVYFRETNESELAEGKAKVVLSEFKLEYKGNDVGVFKKVDSSTPVINGAAIKGDNGGSVIFDITSQAMNTGGGKYDLVIGDDILYYEDVTDGVKKKLSEDDYYFEKIAKPGQIVGANGALFSCRVNLDGTYTNIYSAEVYYRLRGENEYKRLDLDDYYSSACAANTWSFTNSDELKGNVVGWRVVIKDMDRDIKDYTLKTTVTLKSQNLPENGKVYNFSYVEMDRNGVIVNVPELESYAEGVTRDKIAPYDLATYGHYQQRWVAEKEWEGYVLGNIIRRPYPNIYNSSKPVFDNSSDGFVGVMKGTLFTTEYSTDGEKNPKLFTAQMKDEDYISRVYGEFMLPEGVMLLSTKEEILDSI